MISRRGQLIQIFDQWRIAISPNLARKRAIRKARDVVEAAGIVQFVQQQRQGLLRLSPQDEINKRKCSKSRPVDHRRLWATQDYGAPRPQGFQSTSDPDRQRIAAADGAEADHVEAGGNAGGGVSTEIAPGTRTTFGKVVVVKPVQLQNHGLLELLMRRAGRVVTRDNLIESVWGFDSEVRSNTLDAFIRLLRDKVDTDGEPKLIQTVRGVGYCLRIEEA